MAIKDSHGGHRGKGQLPRPMDPGAVSAGYTEAQVAYNINKAIVQFAKVPDTSDTTGTTINQNLSNIVRNMNRYSGDYHLSIHLNAFNGKASGIEVWYWAGDAASKTKAIELAAALATLTGLPNRGAKATTSFYVLRNSVGRTLLVEVGFIDNPSDRKAVIGHEKAIGETIAKVMGHKAPNKPKESTKPKEPTKPKVDLSKYYTNNPGMVQLLKDDGLFGKNDTEFKGGYVGGTYKKGTQFRIVGIKYSKAGYPRLITESGYLLTANRSLVKQINTNTVSQPKPKYTNQQMAKKVQNGEYGNDPYRTKKLTAEGYNAKAIQDIVNRM